MIKKTLFIGITAFMCYTFLFSQPVENFGNYSYLYAGSIDKYNISIVLFSFGYSNKETTELFGYYYYNKNKIPIFFKGNKTKGEITLNEYLDNGKVNATFKLKESKTLDCTGI